MIESLHYWFMNLIGYRKICFDAALSKGIPLTSYQGWFYRPKWVKGTYRERSLCGEYVFVGYGIDK